MRSRKDAKRTQRTNLYRYPRHPIHRTGWESNFASPRPPSRTPLGPAVGFDQFRGRVRGPLRPPKVSSIHLIMTTDIKQNNLLISNHHSKRNPVTIRKADRLNTFQFPPKAVKFKTRLKGVFSQVFNNASQTGSLNSGCFLKNFLCTSEEVI